MTDRTGLIYVRVTVKMQGVAPGDHVWVNPDDPKIRELLIGGQGGPYLVPADEPAPTVSG
jgi:hypothetical protein